MNNNDQIRHSLRLGLQQRWLDYYKNSSDISQTARISHLPTNATQAVIAHLAASISDLDKVLSSFIDIDSSTERDRLIKDKVRRDYEKVVKLYNNARESGLLKRSDDVLNDLLKNKPKLFAYINKHIRLDDDKQLLAEANVVLSSPSTTDSEKKLAVDLLRNRLAEHPGSVTVPTVADDHKEEQQPPVMQRVDHDEAIDDDEESDDDVPQPPRKRMRIKKRRNRSSTRTRIGKVVGSPMFRRPQPKPGARSALPSGIELN